MSRTRLVKTPGKPNVSALGSANWLIVDADSAEDPENQSNRRGKRGKEKGGGEELIKRRNLKSQTKQESELTDVSDFDRGKSVSFSVGNSVQELEISKKFQGREEDRTGVVK